MLEGIPASLIEGRLLEAIPKAERGVASCGGGSQLLASGGPGPRRRALRPGCEELAERIRVMPETEARPRVKNRHGGAPRGERPASWDARRLARRLACRVVSAFTRVFDALWHAQRVPRTHPNVSRRSAHPSIR